jgi:putative toxin-antitoxin system antitoxin component (TIGR02293 family)
MVKVDKDVQDFLKAAQGPVAGQISMIRGGIRRSLFTKMARHIGMPQNGLARTLKLNERTLRNRSARQRLTQAESERSFRVARVCARAIRALGSDESARKWIVAPIKSLGDRRPIDFLETDVGTQEVLNVLNAIEWGVYL